MMKKSDFEETKRKLADELGRALVDRGLIIEAGFLAFKAMFVHDEAPAEQVKDLKICFFAGAEHLFGTMVSMLDPQAEPTEADLRRMDSINNELEPFREYLQKAYEISQQQNKGKPN